VHFIFFNEPPSARPFTLYHFLAVESALQRLCPLSVRFYTKNMPYGPLWERLEERIEIVHLDPPTEIFGRPLRHYAHQADVTRLNILIEFGGIYLDIDTMVRRSFDPLLTGRLVMGFQKDLARRVGLCNAVMHSERNHPFLLEWRDRFRTFRSFGVDQFWAEHSVWGALKLSGLQPDGIFTKKRSDIDILPPSAFFEPSYWPYDLKRLFEKVSHLKIVFVIIYGSRNQPIAIWIGLLAI